MRRVLAVLFVVAVAATGAEAQGPQSTPAATMDAPQSQSTDEGLLRRLMTTLIRDVKQLANQDNLPVLMNGAMLAAGAYPFDAAATHGAASSPLLKTGFGNVGKGLGREYVQGGVALGGYIAGHIWNIDHLVAASGDLIEAQLVSVALTQGLKFAVRRTRPDGEARSFPSGHASAAFATATTLSRHYGRKIGWPAYAIAAYTSASRLQANSHYASDVIFGAALGMAVARTATFQVGRRQLQVAPAAVAHGAGVLVFVH